MQLSSSLFAEASKWFCMDGVAIDKDLNRLVSEYEQYDSDCVIYLISEVCMGWRQTLIYYPLQSTSAIDYTLYCERYTICNTQRAPSVGTKKGLMVFEIDTTSKKPLWQPRIKKYNYLKNAI